MRLNRCVFVIPMRLLAAFAGLSWGALACGSPGQERSATPSNDSSAATASAAPAPSASVAASAVDPEGAPALMNEVRYLASADLRGRGSASPDERRAAEHLAGEMRDIGLEPLAGGSFIEEFDVGSRKSANVVGVLKANGKDASVVLLGAHYDHLGVHGNDTYFGADDNASGVAAVLGVARKLAKDRSVLGRSVVFALFGAEEIGLVGSRAFVSSGPLKTSDIVTMINVDMVGRPLSDQALLRPMARVVGIDPDHSVGIDGLRNRPSLEAIVRGACESEHERAITIDDLPEQLRATAEMMTQGRGDNWSFEAAGVPSVFISSAESGDYHQPTDTPDTLSPELLAERARIIERIVVGVSKLEHRP